MRHIFYISIFQIQFSFEFIHLQICYQLLICRVAKNLPVLELLNNFIKSSTVDYKRVAYKKNLVYNLSTETDNFDFLDQIYPKKGISSRKYNKQSKDYKPLLFMQ